MRGEYYEPSVEPSVEPELPPRARRILPPRSHGGDIHGTTSACAENTDSPVPLTSTIWNYLRVRGEYRPRVRRRHGNRELPPRARRIQKRGDGPAGGGGTTSACAENTPPCPLGGRAWGNYLRVRGEYYTPAPEKPADTELPPRARRIPITLALLRYPPGTTSACAENTPRGWKIALGAGNYLRVRGEYCVFLRFARWSVELPPRARRIHHGPDTTRTDAGTTSACAENTFRPC